MNLYDYTKDNPDYEVEQERWEKRIRCMSKVTYESPDKGKTIYARENGTLNKVLIKKP